jgi:hypothetical protein
MKTIKVREFYYEYLFELGEITVKLLWHWWLRTWPRRRWRNGTNQ